MSAFTQCVRSPCYAAEQVDMYSFCVSELLVPELYSQFLGLLRTVADGQEELAVVES